MTHALVTALVQLAVWAAAGDPVAGGALLVAFYAGREIAQAEYRAIGDGKRADMSWYDGLKPKHWTAGSALDAGLPLVVCVALGVFL